MKKDGRMEDGSASYTLLSNHTLTCAFHACTLLICLFPRFWLSSVTLTSCGGFSVISLYRKGARACFGFMRADWSSAEASLKSESEVQAPSSITKCCQQQQQRSAIKTLSIP